MFWSFSAVLLCLVVVFCFHCLVSLFFLSPSSLFLGESSFIGLDTNRAEINNLALSEMKSCLLIFCEYWCPILVSHVHHPPFGSQLTSILIPSRTDGTQVREPLYT